MTDIQSEMQRQYPTINGWICPSCRNYKGGLNCKHGVLICWTGANMLGCQFYIEETSEQPDCRPTTRRSYDLI